MWECSPRRAPYHQLLFPHRDVSRVPEVNCVSAHMRKAVAVISGQAVLCCGHTKINKSCQHSTATQQRGCRQLKFLPNRWHVLASSAFPRSFPTTATTCRPPLACKTRSSCIRNHKMFGSQNPTRAWANWYFNIYDKSCSGRDRPTWNSQYPHPPVTPPDKVVWSGTNKSFLQFSILMASDPLTTFYGDWNSWFGAHFRPKIGETTFCN